MKWVIALNAALVGIVVLIGGVFASSLVRGAVRPAPVVPAVMVKKPDSPKPLPLKVPPVCNSGVDLRTGELVLKVTNVSDEPLSYGGSDKSDPILRVDKYMSGQWVEGSEVVMCGLGIERFAIKPGETVTFREAISGMLFPVRYYRTFSASGGRSSEMFLGEYWP